MKCVPDSFSRVWILAITILLTAGAGQAAGSDLAWHPPQAEAGQSAGASADRLVYADFEGPQNERPVSSRNGLVQLTSYGETATRPGRFKGAAQSSPPAPEIVRLKKDDPNRAITFDYELPAPNQYAGVSVEVQGQPEQDGKLAADDVSGYKFLTMQVYVTGVPAMRVEFISRGHGINMSGGYPQATFKITPGFNTYKIPLKSLNQPSWAQPRVNVKDLLKKLTSISLTAYCDQCTPITGTVVVDNIVFEK